MIAASLKNYRISPRKARLVADTIRGKSVLEARNILAHGLKKGTDPISGLLASAVANAKNNFQIEDAVLFVKEIRVDQGYALKRHRPVSRGSAHPFKRKTSHVSIILAPREESVKSKVRKSVKSRTKK